MNDISQAVLDSVIAENDNFVRSLVYDVGSYHSKEDLYQVAVMGLMNAYRHFDPEYGSKLSTYAYPYIVGEIKKYMREDRNMKVSRDLIYLGSKINKARDMLMQKIRREPTTNELASFLEIEEDKVVEALTVNSYIKSLDEPINSEGKELTIIDIVHQHEPVDKLDLIWLKEELQKLTMMEQQLLNIRYFQDKTQQETADIMHISQVQVSRGEHKALEKLKQGLYH